MRREWDGRWDRFGSLGPGRDHEEASHGRPHVVHQLDGAVAERRLSVDGLCLTDGFTDVGIAQQTARYQEAVSRTPQMA